MVRTTTGGGFTVASFSVNGSVFIECPADTPEFVVACLKASVEQLALIPNRRHKVRGAR